MGGSRGQARQGSHISRECKAQTVPDELQLLAVLSAVQQELRHFQPEVHADLLPVAPSSWPGSSIHHSHIATVSLTAASQNGSLQAGRIRGKLAGNYMQDLGEKT